MDIACRRIGGCGRGLSTGGGGVDGACRRLIFMELAKMCVLSLVVPNTTDFDFDYYLFFLRANCEATSSSIINQSFQSESLT